MQIKNDFAHFAQSLLGFLRTRASLFGIEFSQEKKRFASVAILAVLALLFMVFAFLMLNIGVLVYFWDTEYRLWAAFGLVAFYLLATVVCVINLRSQLKDEAFPHTKATLKQDIEQFQSQPHSLSRPSTAEGDHE
ncbi:MAG: phage holin family protein [Pelistega sp.]|nr:phage holin family protein [Pelistega sp.]